MNKLRYIALTILSTLTLASCSLFSDADITIQNKFKPKGSSNQIVVTSDKIGDVYGVKVSDVPNTTVFKNVVYSNMEENQIRNTYTSANSFKYNVNGGSNYTADKNNNNVDIYVPDGLDKNGEHNVVLFIHGGAWISGLKSHVNPYVKKFAKEGYIAATIEYTLLSADMNNSSLSVFRDLDEIDACITTMKNGLGELGFDNSKLSLVLGGASSGAHLAMLYAYSRGNTSPMQIKFLIDAVGPTDIKVDAWKAFNATGEDLAQAIEDGIDKDTIADRGSSGLKTLPVSGQGYDWNDYQTMRIANGMCGLPFTLGEVEASSGDQIHVNTSSAVYQSIVDDPSDDSGEDLLSVTFHMNSSNKIPMICAYAGEDSVVGINQFATLQTKLASLGTEYQFVYFKHCGHVDLDTDETKYNEFINKILLWMSTK